MNYETASNQQLNEKLASLSGFSYAEFTGELGAGRIPNYCTDWNTTMPLAVEHGVGFNPMLGGDYKSFEVYDKHGISGSDIADEKSVLRAIVICLIKVLEANQ